MTQYYRMELIIQAIKKKMTSNDLENAFWHLNLLHSKQVERSKKKLEKKVKEECQKYIAIRLALEEYKKILAHKMNANILYIFGSLLCIHHNRH